MVFVMRTILLAMVILLLATTTVQADSYVYITNSTADHVAVDVKHFSSGSLLTMGSQWRQEVTAIPPYATRRVLAFNRNQGVKRNQSYVFETALSANGSTVIAMQKMVGNWVAKRQAIFFAWTSTVRAMASSPPCRYWQR